MKKSNQKKVGAICLTLATILLFNSGCETAGKNTGMMAGAGAAAGAVLGAVVSKDRKKGALLGASVGAAIGGTAGYRMDKQKKELEKIAETKRTEQGLITKLKSDILFDTGKADLKPQAQSNLGQMAAIMKKYPENILTIKGYTDNTGSADINKALSKKRAEAVRTQLIAGGIPATSISVVGMGPQSPVADNKTADGRAQNRRVEIEVTIDESKVPKDS